MVCDILGSMISERDECFSVIMDIGRSMMGCGADVHTIEELLTRMGRAYGASRMNVLVITAEIIVTAFFPGEREITYSRRITSEGGSNFTKLDALSNLCNACCEKPIPAKELRSRFDDIDSEHISNLALYLGGIFAASGFAVFFGGGLSEALLAAVFAILTCFSIERFRPIVPNVLVFNFVTSLIVGTIICFTAEILHGINVNMVIVGVIMLLIPGVAMTNSTRDMLSGDTISGVMRFIESLLWAGSLAIGFMVALWFATLAGIENPELQGGADWPLYTMIPITFLSALGFAFFFNVQPRYIIISSIGGLLTWLVYFGMHMVIDDVFIPTLVASSFAAIFAEVLAWILKVPNEGFFIIAVIPLVPGRLLYYTMYCAVQGAWNDCITYGLQMIYFAAGIALGICLVAAALQIRDGFKRQIAKGEFI